MQAPQDGNLCTEKTSTISCKIQAFGKKIANYAHGKMSKLSTYQNYKNTTRISKKRLILRNEPFVFGDN